MQAFRFYAGVCAVAAAAAFAMPAAAQESAADYPSRSIQMISPFAPGGSTDPMGRLVADRLQAAWGQSVVVENRPGAGGSIGAAFVAQAAPDGYTIMITNPGPSLASTLLRADKPFDVDDLAPVIMLGHTPLIAIGALDAPGDDLAEIVEYARQNPGQVLFASSGTNSNPHLALEVLKSATGADITHVPYQGSGPAITDLIAGSVHGVFTTTVSAGGLIEAGEVKVLGVAGPERQATIPDAPTLTELGIEGADNLLWIGVQVPTGTPDDIIGKINAELNAMLEEPEVQELFAQWGLTAAGGTPEDFGAQLQGDGDRIRSLIDSGAVQLQ